MDPELLEEVEAVLRESLTNVARHASAKTVDVILTASDAYLELNVVDDGIGLDHSKRQGGLDNLRRRAAARAGQFEVISEAEKGTELRWSVPLT
jgi:signal transduction histidine kinase